MRSIRRLLAFFLRTFVTDCPVCHKHFYGHQAHGVNMVIQHKNYRIVCPRCSKEHAK